MLGHANISIILDTYSHVIPEMGEAAVSAMEDVLGTSSAGFTLIFSWLQSQAG